MRRCHRWIMGPALCGLWLLITVAAHAQTPPGGEVTLAAEADGVQPAGWPVVVRLTLTNLGDKPIGWWCGGPDVYPPAEHFKVHVRYGAQTQWHDVQATNGQYVVGSGFTRQLGPHESIVVPLAIPVEKDEGISIRIETTDWHTEKPVELYVRALHDRQYLDPRQAQVIEAAIAHGPAFERHLAEQYADATVIDAMLKLVTVDNAPIVAGAARVLARQQTLPESAGKDLANTVTRWLARSPRPDWGGLQSDLVTAALKTRSASARRAVLEMLNDPPTPSARAIAINALRLSPGDDAWLRQARDAIVTAQQASPNDADLARQVKLAVDWLNGPFRAKRPAGRVSGFLPQSAISSPPVGPSLRFGFESAAGVSKIT